jgi:hypothetical protein
MQKRILILNPHKWHCDNLSHLFMGVPTVTMNYLAFLHNLEGNEWDSIYLTYDLTANETHDHWVDGNGVRRAYNGLHAVRAIATMKEMGRCNVRKIFLQENSKMLKEMSDILASAEISFTTYSVEEDERILALSHDQGPAFTRQAHI